MVDNIRRNIAIKAGIIGCVCNIFLFVIKYLSGKKADSIAVISDAFNNLSDCFSCIIVIIAAILAIRKADKEHPYGHGRWEYITSFTVSILIIVCGFQLFLTSVNKILNPEFPDSSIFVYICLGISIFVKLGMFLFYSLLYKKTKNSVLMTSALDSLSDVLATSVVLFAIAVNTLYFNKISNGLAGKPPTPNFSIDGIAGLLVSLLIVWNGLKSAKTAVDSLIGTAPPETLRDEITKIILKQKGVLDIHDLEIHDYGYNQFRATAHAEVDKNSNLLDIHTIIDNAEKEVEKELSVKLVIHPDPV
jgi:cation diffusion facilitator family transporter